MAASARRRCFISMRGVGDREAIGGEHGLDQSGAAAGSAGYREAELCRPAVQLWARDNEAPDDQGRSGAPKRHHRSFAVIAIITMRRRRRRPRRPGRRSPFRPQCPSISHLSPRRARVTCHKFAAWGMPLATEILTAWPTAAAYLQGARPAPAPAPSSAGAHPDDIEGEPVISRYRASFRATFKACQLEAKLAGESTSARDLLGKVNARMREMNTQRGTSGESKILNAWNKARCRNAGKDRKPKPCARLDGVNRKRDKRRKPSSAGAPVAAAAPADTSTATVTPAVTFAGAPASAKDTFILSAFLQSPEPAFREGSSVAGAAEPAEEPSPAGAELCLDRLLGSQ